MSQQSAQCDRLAERVLLDRSVRLARIAVAGWPGIVEGRLETQQAVLGDEWTNRETDKLLEEVGDECIDAAAWSCLAVQSLTSAEFDPETVAAVGEMVSRAVGAAAEAYACIVAAQTRLKRSR